MKISLNWLNELVPVSQDARGVQGLVDDLTMLGFEVESVTPFSRDLSGVICARITEVNPHPDADKLRLVTVDRGADGPLTLVCGAPNVRTGMRVPLARLGATLPGMDGPLKKAKIRGVVSEGMLCSNVELGLSDDHSGLLELDESWAVGESLQERLGCCDTVLDVDITQNRGDAFSILGLARELAACRKLPLSIPASPAPARSPQTLPLTVTIEECCAREAAPRYMGLLLDNVSVAPSPRWLQDRLEAVGLRAINNVVDVTNYVMWELGHPLHAFDLRQVRGSAIHVRFAQPGESFVTLDGATRELDGSEVLICDSERPVALGGIMGGENSGIADDTTSVLLECACFDPVVIRMGARRLNIASDSARRFERGVDMQNLDVVIQRAAGLLSELAGARIAGDTVDCHPAPRSWPEVTLRPQRANSLLGLQLSPDTMAAHLRSLGIEVHEDAGLLKCTAPGWRFDLEREVDFIEEIVRLEGYDSVPSALNARVPLDQPQDARPAFQRRLRDRLVQLGFRQISSYSMMDPAVLDAVWPARPSLIINNPLAAEMSRLRNSLLPSLLQAAIYNLNRRQRVVRLFELDREFHPDGQSDTGCREPRHLCAVLAGDFREAGWLGAGRTATVHDLREALLALLDELGATPEFRPCAEGPWSENSREVLLDGVSVGTFGEIRPQVLEALGGAEAVFAFDLDLEVLLARPTGERQFRSFPRQPAVHRDLSVLLDKAREAAEVEELIRKQSKGLLQDLRLFDVYEGQGVPAGKHSLSWALQFNSEERSLSDGDVEPVMRRIIAALERDLAATLRT
ncbi:MAG: phenylalanine--tRNA ligase subunit beta [Candidatus Cloacimonetes bacterium]|nr:phenylalanine--tRNA ligase subunit beta [Candidatus Cloacimonadota bacterium]